MVIIGLVIKSFRNYLNNIFRNFEVQSNMSKEVSKKQVIYEKDGIVVMKGESNKQND